MPEETNTNTTTENSEATAEAKRVRRIFMYGTMRLDDPNPALKPLEVKAHYAATYPDLTSASCTLEKTEEKNGVKTETWQLKRSVGTKG